MKIQFVIPNFMNRTKEYLVLPSLEVCIMSQVLKDEGYDVGISDMRINDYTSKELIESLKDADPDIVCIDDIPESHCCTKIILPEIRNCIKKESIICVRGELESFEPEMFLRRNPEIDFILRYETDYALLHIAQYLEKKKCLDDIKNIAYIDKNGEVKIHAIESVNLNDLPMPDRKLYDIEKYLMRDSETIVKSSRGCPGKCLFCIKTKFEPFKVFSMERFCDEIEELTSYGFKSFFFSDDNFAFSMERLYEFERQIIKRNMNIKWTSNLRIKDISHEKIKLMKKLGAYRIFVGIETLNSKTSKIINKNLSEEYIREKIKILKDNGMQFHASFILGNPGDTEDDLQATLDFVKDVQPDLVTFNLINIYPGLDIYKHPEKYGMVMDDLYWFEKDEWTKHPVMGTIELPPSILKKWSGKMLFEYMTSR